MEVGTPITPKHPAYRSIVSFLRENSVSFAQSGFEEITDHPRQHTGLGFAGIPFVCVINAESLMDNRLETRLKKRVSRTVNKG